MSSRDDRNVDRVFKALADRTRRRMVDLLAERPRTTGELSSAFPKLSRFAVMKHLGVLEKAGLLVVTRDGRKRWNSLNSVPLRQVLRRWMSRHDEFWAESLLNIRDAAEGDGSASGAVAEKASTDVPSVAEEAKSGKEPPSEGKEAGDEFFF